MQFLRKNNTDVFLFAQFLRCQPNFAAIGLFGAEIRGGGLRAAPPPPPPRILMERNSPVQLGLKTWHVQLWDYYHFYILVTLSTILSIVFMSCPFALYSMWFVDIGVTFASTSDDFLKEVVVDFDIFPCVHSRQTRPLHMKAMNMKAPWRELSITKTYHMTSVFT